MRNNGTLPSGADETRSLLKAIPENNGSSTLGHRGFAPNQYYGPENEILLREYWRAIYKHLWLVIGVTILVVLLATIYVAQQPDIYEAQALVQVDLQQELEDVEELIRMLTSIVKTTSENMQARDTLRK